MVEPSKCTCCFLCIYKEEEAEISMGEPSTFTWSSAKGCIVQYRVFQAKISFGQMGLTSPKCWHGPF